MDQQKNHNKDINKVKRVKMEKNWEYSDIKPKYKGNDDLLTVCFIMSP